MNSTHDVIIVGAGAAGLACSQELIKKGLDVLVLEARSRLGGRVFTIHPDEHKSPVELGAEFIHGYSEEMSRILNSAHLPFYDANDDHYFLKDKKLVLKPKYWDQMVSIFKRIPKSKDRSVQNFLDNSRLKGEQKELFTAFVEGFHAAELDKMSAVALAESESGEDPEIQGATLFRHPCGYSEIFKNISLPAEALRLNTVVKKIHWQPGKVSVYARVNSSKQLNRFTAKKIIVTWPLGVWKAAPEEVGHVQWSPALPHYFTKSLDKLEMGHVQRLVLRFRSRFWEELTEKPIGFMHASNDNYFPTWWTLMPTRSPHLVAWQGGAKAKQMMSWSKHKKIQCALKTLSKLTNKSLNFLNDQVEACHTHDWSNDPFSLGAYSYVKKNLARVEIFQKSVDKTVYFGGEHTLNGAGRGTVHGAIETGMRVAQLVSEDFFNVVQRRRSVQLSL